MPQGANSDDWQEKCELAEHPTGLAAGCLYLKRRRPHANPRREVCLVGKTNGVWLIHILGRAAHPGGNMEGVALGERRPSKRVTSSRENTLCFLPERGRTDPYFYCTLLSPFSRSRRINRNNASSALGHPLGRLKSQFCAFFSHVRALST